MRCVWLLLLVLMICVPGFAQERTLPPGFDPQRHMLVSEVKPGMKGYGLSVFMGTKIERFDVEVISILKNFNPRQDVVLIRATGCNLEHTGAIAGMSGSPIYLKDDNGKDRMIGAFAYGWPMMKDPLAGVQPIEYMLSIPLQASGDPAKRAIPSPKPLTVDGPAGTSSDAGGNWSVLTALLDSKAAIRNQLAAQPQPSTNLTQMRPLMVPLAASGIAARSLQQLAGAFDSLGMVPLQAGGGTGTLVAPTTAPANARTRLEPGSVMAIPLLTGDMDLTAVGTCTDVVGDRVYGFGHPFTSEGPVAMPMCSGSINGIIANLVTSFKLGAATAQEGTLLADQTTGVAGRIGTPAVTAPMKLRVHYADQSLDQTFRFNAVVHPRYTPLLASTAMFGAISASRELPHHNTVRYNITANFADGHVVKLSDTLSDVNPATLFAELGAPLTAAAENPFARVLLKDMEGEVEVWDDSREAQILSAGVSRQVYRPGDTVRFFAAVRPFRGVDVIHPLEFKLPDDLPDGSYTITISDLTRFMLDEHTNSPFRFAASNINDVFDAINEIGKLQSDSFYLRLIRTNQSVAIGRAAMPRLPGTQRQMLLEATRADVVAYTPSVTSIIPCKWVLGGSADLPIRVNQESRQIPSATSAQPQTRRSHDD
jgi:hypothetical protein